MTFYICKKTFYYILNATTTISRSEISSVADGFHLAQQDFICRQANFIARTLLYAVGVFHKVLTLKTAIYLLSVIQTLL